MTRIARLKLVLNVAAGFAIAVGAASAAEQAAFPTKPLRWVLPYPAGGPADLVARHVAAKLTEAFGQNVLLDYRPGASGMIGLTEFTRANADGYTLLFQIVTTAAIHPHVYKNAKFHWTNDFQPVARIAVVPNVLIVNKNVPAKNVKELIALAKANPGKLTYSSSGNASILHLSGALFAKQAGVEMLHVPYKGGAQALQDVVAGEITMIFANIPGLPGMIKSGQVRALAVTTPQRVPALPDVPTVVESGLPNFQNSSWYAIFTRAGVPAPVLKKLETESLRAINSPDLVARLTDIGAVPAPMGAAQLEKFWKSEIEYWRPIATDPSIKLDGN